MLAGFFFILNFNSKAHYDYVIATFSEYISINSLVYFVGWKFSKTFTILVSKFTNL